MPAGSLKLELWQSLLISVALLAFLYCVIAYALNKPSWPQTSSRFDDAEAEFQHMNKQ